MLLFTDFGGNDWYRAWGARSVSQNCDLVSGERAIGAVCVFIASAGAAKGEAKKETA